MEIWRFRYCQNVQHPHLYSALQFIGMKNESELFSNDEWAHVAIVRDPVQRFISGFVDKCVRQKVES